MSGSITSGDNADIAPVLNLSVEDIAPVLNPPVDGTAAVIAGAILSDNNIRNIVSGIDAVTSKITGTVPKVDADIGDAGAHILQNISHMATHLNGDKDITDIRTNITQLLGKFGVHLPVAPVVPATPAQVQVLPDAPARQVPKSVHTQQVPPVAPTPAQQAPKSPYLQQVLLQLCVLLYVWVQQKLIPQIRVWTRGALRTLVIQICIYTVLRYLSSYFW